MKYDFDLDLASDNSLSIIAKKIRPNSRVLEFGPAAGRLTKYMKEVLNCSVYIVEIDDLAAEKASIYADKTIVGDIEDYKWLVDFKDLKFDYILFADVLEHLYDAKKVLQKTKELLVDKGSIIISIPNVTHSSLIADLLVNKFEYRATGLLDDTHIRFFTHQSICEMVETCGFFPFSKEAVYKNVYESELGSQFDLLPRNTQKLLKNKEFADVYQFIMELKDVKFEKDIIKISNLNDANSYYFSQLYINSGKGFNELQSLKKDIYLSFDLCKVSFNLTSFGKISSLRFDPININSYIQITSITYKDLEGRIYPILEYQSNAIVNVDNKLLFNVEDPQIIFNLENQSIENITITFKILDAEFDDFSFVSDLISENYNLIGIKNEINNQNVQLNIEKSEQLEKISKIESHLASLKQFEVKCNENQTQEILLKKKIQELESLNTILKNEITSNLNRIQNLELDVEQSKLKLDQINKSTYSKIKNVFNKDQ